MSEMRECLGCLGKHVSVVHDCPVCLGTGRVEAKPSVRDAVADAEALLSVVIRGGRARKPYRDLWYAGMDVAEAVAGYRDFGATVPKAARAAFRAVPGLRG